VTDIELAAFSGCDALTSIEIAETSHLTTLGDQAFELCPNLKTIFLPESVTDIGANLFGPGDEKKTVFAFFDSYVMQWAKAIGMPYRVAPSSGTMSAHPPGLMYEYIPYQFTPQTRVPDNEDLIFRTEPALPAGLLLVDGSGNYPDGVPAGLIPGTIYGAPLEYEPFRDGVAFKLIAQNTGIDAGNFRAEADFVIKLAPRPTDFELDNIINDFTFIDNTPTGGNNGRIDVQITGLRADYAKNQIMHIDGPYPQFESLWIDGVKQVIGSQYTAEDGSTTVTIVAQTFRELDNGRHTVAAAFHRVDYGEDIGGSHNNSSDLDVVAQNFNVNLSGNNENNNHNDDRDIDDLSDADASNPPTNNADGNENAVNDENIVTNVDATNNVTSTSVNESSVPENAPSVPANAPSVPVNAPFAPVNAPTATLASLVTAPLDAETPPPAGETSPATPAAPITPEITGLATDGNGDFFFDYDGSGPLEVRIDIPLEEFTDLYLDGELWARGTDYTVRSGSTILTIAAAQLEELSAGTHTLTASFRSQNVEISFTLNKTLTPTGLSGAMTVPAFPAAVAAVVLATGVLAAAVVIWRKRNYTTFAP
jgi:hypothetical protein